MWEKLKKWWKKFFRKEKEDCYFCDLLLVSVYFNSDKDWIVTDFSEWEENGIIHYMMFTREKGKDYTYGLDDAIVYFKEFEDGSSGWLFR